MPQWRKLWIKTTESLDVNDMPDDFHRLLWVMLPLISCREGRGMDNPAWIKAKAMPLRMDISPDQVELAVAWYAGRGMLTRYEVNGRRYYQIQNWHRYQGSCDREADTDYPEPSSCDGDVTSNTEVTTNSRPTPEQVTTNSRPAQSKKRGEEKRVDTEAFAVFLSNWAELFPGKPQPKTTTTSLSKKLKTRLDVAAFRDGWRDALARASKSTFCNTGGWFTAHWFLANDENWRKCADGNYDNEGAKSNGVQPNGGWHIPG